MNVKEIRLQTNMSQRAFADMFGIPINTLQDWEQGRRVPPSYVSGMIRQILEMQGFIMDENYIDACERRKKSVERALAIMLTATNGPDEAFMGVLDSYVAGKITLKEIEARVERLEYL